MAMAVATMLEIINADIQRYFALASLVHSFHFSILLCV